jgi:D-xylose 1-dehydrogenase
VSNTTSYSSLANLSIFITGGATGIGAAMVKAFLAQGAKVSFVDINHEATTNLINSLEKQWKENLWHNIVDVTNIESLQQAISNAASQQNGIDVLINNVANDMRHKPQDITQNDWHHCMQVNLDSAFFASQAASAYMKKKKHGSIINLSSINAILGPQNMVGYTTAKAGLIGMTKSLAKDFGKFNIRVNAILPGWIATDKQLASYLTEYEEDRWMDSMAIKKRIAPKEVAHLALFLASDDSAMITGQSITIDGGRT